MSDSPECSAFISRETGQIFWVSERAGIEEEIPDDVDDEERYIGVPNKGDLELGRALVFEFVRQSRPGVFRTVSEFFRRRSAYRRFKGWLEQKGLTQQWYDFEQTATDEAPRTWCRENDIEPLEG